MMKKILSASLLSVFAFVGTQAYNVNDFVYTKTAKYQITGGNLVQNGDFSSAGTGTDGWTAIDAANPLASVFSLEAGLGFNGGNALKVLDGHSTLKDGMYQVVPVDNAGSYVVTLRVEKAEDGLTDLDMSADNTNYINVYYNTDGAVATSATAFGTDGVSAGHGFVFKKDEITEASFAVEAPANGFIVIDFRGLNAGLQISGVECHLANSVVDTRVVERRIAYLRSILASIPDVETREAYEDVQYGISNLEELMANNAGSDAIRDAYENELEIYWADFATKSLANMIDYVSSDNNGNNSANWMKWNGHYNKLALEYKGVAPWSWTTDRWCHKTKDLEVKTDVPMGIEWQQGGNGNWDNRATLTVTLDKGVYFWGVSAKGGRKTLSKGSWTASWAGEYAKMQLFANEDTTEAVMLDPAVAKDYVMNYVVAQDGTEVKIGIICNTTGEVGYGFDARFASPVLYKVLEKDALTPEQEAYLKDVQTQLDALKGRIDVANGYVAETQKELPWGKEDLVPGIEAAQKLYDGWAAMTQDDILNTMYDDTKLYTIIMNDGVRALNNNYITPFVKKNAPLTNMPGAIEAANTVKAQRIYSGSTKMTDLENKIQEAQNMYDAKLNVPFSTEDSLALVNEKAELEAMVEDFKNAIVMTTLVDIDFGTDDEPATVETHEATDVQDAYYSITGKQGVMTFDANTYELGYTASATSGTKYPGTLRVGNGEATVAVTGAPVKESDIVNIQFDLYVGNLVGKYAGFYVMSEANDTVCGLYFSKYDGKAEYNPFNVDFNGKINGVGSSKAANDAIAAESNRTHFDIVLDYGARTMYCTTTGSKGTAITEEVALKNVVPAKFVLKSNYNNNDRRCWFDNLVISNIAAGPTNVKGVTVVEGESSNAIYNVAGQQISAPAKGQIYITNGAKYVK